MDNTEYKNKIKFRETVIDGVCNWMWVETDDGAWRGPSREWETTHKDAYLKYCKQRRVVVQAGGNCGLYPRLFAKYFERVYTFEPDALNFHCLVNNCQLPNIIKINAALGDVNKMVNINNGNLGNVGTFTILEDQHNYIPMFTVDQLSLDACDLMQLDVEGYEDRIIRGAAQTIERFKPVVSMETVNRQSEAFLMNFGYQQVEKVGADKIFAII